MTSLTISLHEYLCIDLHFLGKKLRKIFVYLFYLVSPIEKLLIEKKGMRPVDGAEHFSPLF